MYRIPILRMGRTLLVTIQIDMEDQTAMALQDDLAEQISKTGANGVLIDISALEIVDSFVGRMLAAISGIGQILDATTVVVGMKPAVAITLVEPGHVAGRRQNRAQRQPGHGAAGSGLRWRPPCRMKHRAQCLCV